MTQSSSIRVLSRLLSPSFFACALLGALPAGAEPGDARARAAVHFERGLRYLDEGSLETAVVELESANELVPEARTAYNVALAYARLHRPREAVQVLRECKRRHLSIESELAGQIERLLTDQAGRLGQLKLVLETPNGEAAERAKVLLDGVEHPFVSGQPIEVATGFVVVGVSAPGMMPISRRVALSGGETRELVLRLEPAEISFSTLSVASNVPGVGVVLDGKFLGNTPLPAIRTTPGRHVLEAKREGYEPQTKEIMADARATVSARFELVEVRQSRRTGELALRLSEPQALVSVDGQRRPAAQVLRLIDGPHLLRVEAAGHEPVERLVHVATGKRLERSVWLEPTAQTKTTNDSAVETRRFWGWTSLISGAALGGGSLAFLAYNSGQSSDNDQAISDFNATTRPGQECEPGRNVADCKARSLELSEEQSGLETQRVLGLVGLGLGIAGATTGSVLLLTGPESYGEKRRRFLQVSWAKEQGTGASLELSGSF